MGIFARLASLVKSNLNDMISSAEDPEKMLNQVVVDMANQLIEAKKHVAVAIADEKKLAKQAEGEAAKAAEWHRRAKMAVRGGNDALAKEALQRQREHDGLSVTFKDQWSKQKTQVDRLKQTLRVLNNTIEEAKRKKQMLIARRRRAMAQKQIQETMAGLNNASAFDTFNRMEEKIIQEEAEADAVTELAEEYSGDILAHKFGELEASQGAVDDLLSLKQEMGLAPAAMAKAEPAPAMRVDADPIDELGSISAEEEQELAAALAELEAQEQAEQARMKR